MRDFAKALGKLAKTDAIDAWVLARFGALMRPEIRPIKGEETRELATLVTPRRQLLGMRTAKKTHLRQTSDKWTKKDIKSHIKALYRYILKMEKEIQNHNEHS